jgi:nitrogen fixation protein FixH
MAMIMVAFFGVVIAVNITMATLARQTFGGTVVDNSYVASQQYNGWLKAARSQAALGWETRISLDAARHPVLAIAAKDAAGFAAQGIARHPLGRAPAIDLMFVADGAGQLVARQALPPGRWQVAITLRRAGQAANLAADVQ